MNKIKIISCLNIVAIVMWFYLYWNDKNDLIFKRPVNEDNIHSFQREGKNSVQLIQDQNSEDEDFDEMVEMYGSFNMSPVNISDIVEGWRDQICADRKTYYDIYKLNPPAFLPGYRNPCFMENNQLRCMAHYMLVGFQKCGTTDFYSKMLLHPLVTGASNKEPFYWNRKRLRSSTFDDYLDIFKEASEEIFAETVLENSTVFHPMVTGEASAGTIWDNHNWMCLPENHDFDEPLFLAQHAIKHFIPKTRFIIFVRNPTKRLYSDYTFFVRDATPQKFHDRVRFAIQWLTQCLKTLSRRHCLFDPPHSDLSALPSGYFMGNSWNPIHRLRIGLYSEYMVEWYRVFPPSQTKVVRLEDYSLDRLNVMNSIYEHIGIPGLNESYREAIESEKTKNVQRKKSEPMLEETQILLDEFYRPYNLKLAKLLDDSKFSYET